MPTQTQSNQTRLIQVLSPQLANQIAAGEVVERPSSVIKELVENSIDAGATRIDITVEQGGCKLIRIRDNGAGIPKDQLHLALARHATSKIATLDDLEAIISLGFRGEALASISSVSRLTLTAKTESQNEAWQVYAEGRDMEAVIKPAAHPVGTTVEVLDLFYNTPARRRFLRSEKTEFTHIDEVVRRVALANMNVEFNLNHNGKLIRQYRPVQEVGHYERRIGAIIGTSFIQKTIYIEWNHDDLHIKGWVAQNVDSDAQYFYVNGRAVKDRLLNHAIRQAYQSSDGLGNEPIAYVIYLELDPHQVDVNVHPAKHEVRFHEARLIHDFVYQAILMALNSSRQTSLLPDNKSSATENIGTFSSIAENRIAAGENIFKRSQGNQTQKHKPTQYKTYSSGENRSKGHVQENEVYEQLVKPSVAAVSFDENNTPTQIFPERTEALTLASLTASTTSSTPITSIAAKNSAMFASSKLGKVLTVYQQQYALLEDNQQIQLLSLPLAQQALYQAKLLEQMQRASGAEKLLIPITFLLSQSEIKTITPHQRLLSSINIKFELEKSKLELDEVPLLLRNMNWQQLFVALIKFLELSIQDDPSLLQKEIVMWLAQQYYYSAMDCSAGDPIWSSAQVVSLLTEIEQFGANYFDRTQFIQLVDLSTVIDVFKV